MRVIQISYTDVQYLAAPNRMGGATCNKVFWFNQQMVIIVPEVLLLSKSYQFLLAHVLPFQICSAKVL